MGAVGSVASAQSVGWRAYPAYNEVDALAVAPDGIWAGTDAGVFFYGIPDGELLTVTPADGLAGGAMGAMAYDEARAALWIGYGSGLLERLDPESGEVTPFYALTRADQYPSRGVRRIRVSGDLLYLSTDFGVVVFDVVREEVRATYARIGDLQGGTGVNDVLEAPRPDGGPGLWLATDGGVFYATRGASDLQSPAAWTRAAGAPSPTSSLAAYDGAVFAGGELDGVEGLYRRSASGTWDRQLSADDPVTTLRVDGGRIVALTSSAVFTLRPGQAAGQFRGDGIGALTEVVVGPTGALWVGDAALGLFPLPSAPAAGEIALVTPDPVVPPGPFTNDIISIDVGPTGVLWLVTDDLAAAGTAAVSRLDNGVWTTYRINDPDIDIARSGFRDASAGPDGTFYAGAEGAGLTVFGPDGDVTAYSRNNSSLQGAPGFPDYVRVSDVAFEGGDRWVANLSGRPLHLFAEDGTWAALPFPGGTLPDLPDIQIAVDGFGQKWLALGSGGLAVWDTGDDPASPADDRALRFRDSRQSGQGLPHPDVRDVVVDGEGRVWLGTARGLAYVFSPGSAFGGSAELATPQWARVEDGGDWLLRDVEVNDLEVDPAGQIWVATTTGAYLINAAGDGVVRQFTSANSPLPGDEIGSVAVDPVSGRVFFTTSGGLFSVSGDATRPNVRSEELVVSPSPYRPASGGDGVVVTGLASRTSAVRVMTVSGEVVYAADVAGGSFRWDGRDERTGQPAASGVYLVVAAGADGETLYGKVAVIR